MIGFAIFLSVSTNLSRERQKLAVNATEVGTDPVDISRAQAHDSRVVSDAVAFERQVREGVDNCLRQCELYHVAWATPRRPEEQNHRQQELERAIADHLNELHTEHREINKKLSSFHRPSQKFVPYYEKVRSLHQLYESIFQLATSQTRNIAGFEEKLGKLDYAIQTTLADLDQIRP